MSLLPKPSFKIASRALDLANESAFTVLARARRLEAGVGALRSGHTRYTPRAGLPELRDAIADWLRERGVSVSPERVLVTSGTKPKDCVPEMAREFRLRTDEFVAMLLDEFEHLRFSFTSPRPMLGRALGRLGLVSTRCFAPRAQQGASAKGAVAE